MSAKNLPAPGFDPRTVQPVAHRYTYYASSFYRDNKKNDNNNNNNNNNNNDPSILYTVVLIY
jgi:hypothetical protein